MNRSDAISNVAYVVDDAGSGRALGADPHAIVRCGPSEVSIPHNDPNRPHCYPSVLIGWHRGSERPPMFVAVHSYLDVKLDDSEVEEMAVDYLREILWFNPTNPSRHADFIIR